MGDSFHDPWRRMAKITGMAGLVGAVLLFAPIIALSGLGEPSFDGSEAEIAEFFVAVGDASWTQAAGVVVLLGLLALLWFVVGVALLLRRLRVRPPWRSSIALLSGLLVTVYGLFDVSWSAASNRGGTDPAVAVFAFDAGNLGFANAWLALGSFAMMTGWVLGESRALPRWCAWWAVGTGIAFVPARFVWEADLWLVPYLSVWVGLLALAVRLLRARTAGSPARRRAGRTAGDGREDAVMTALVRAELLTVSSTRTPMPPLLATPGPSIQLDGQLLSAPVAGLVLIGDTAAAVTHATGITPRRDVP